MSGTAGVMSYGVKRFVTDVLKNPELANAVVSGSAGGQQQKQDEKK